MRTISELNMLLRVRVDLPAGIRLMTNEFHEGWNFAAEDASRLEHKIRMHGWNFIKMADGSLRSGVGKTSQEAISNALRLALRSISEHFNVVEVEHIELTQYPWFFLARVKVHPFRIQKNAIFFLPDKFVSSPIASRQKRLPLDAAALYPNSGSAMPILKKC